MARVMFIVQEELRCLHCINLRLGTPFTSIEVKEFESAITSLEEIQAELN